MIKRPKINRIQGIDSHIQNGRGGDASGSGSGAQTKALQPDRRAIVEAVLAS